MLWNRTEAAIPTSFEGVAVAVDSIIVLAARSTNAAVSPVADPTETTSAAPDAVRSTDGVADACATAPAPASALRVAAVVAVVVRALVAVPVDA